MIVVLILLLVDQLPWCLLVMFMTLLVGNYDKDMEGFLEVERMDLLGSHKGDVVFMYLTCIYGLLHRSDWGAPEELASPTWL